MIADTQTHFTLATYSRHFIFPVSRIEQAPQDTRIPTDRRLHQKGQTPSLPGSLSEWYR